MYKTFNTLLLAGCLGVAIAVFGVQPSHAAKPLGQPLDHAHAHNDYLHERPLLDALEHGFTSVEADVFLVEGELLVGHSRQELQPERTLERLYLKPLRELSRAGSGKVWPDGPSLTLLIDVKADGERTYAALAKLLADYDEIASGSREGRFESKAITVIVSGDRAQRAIADDELRRVGIDGRLSDLDSELPSGLLPLISDNWTTHFQWRGDGPFPADERAKLHRIVRQAHEHGRRVRFWATPERKEVWGELLSAEVDLINTDDLAGLEAFLRDASRGK